MVDSVAWADFFVIEVYFGLGEFCLSLADVVLDFGNAFGAMFFLETAYFTLHCYFVWDDAAGSSTIDCADV